ncbi:DUF4097 family beta strand repeat-containing protein [Thermophagus xiamenensis]|uniref:Putative adhesin n=1 Tax=Thermophagus xiamenensis TaxID=385682 RepID=A0A1I1UXW1_9BACT|nr:DUF4097 family beta strand repeat-containing protein [Thermophagus xiamenensis]SFD74538.1 Putative adhesin [Thermophagus xiamenensis]
MKHLLIIFSIIFWNSCMLTNSQQLIDHIDTTFGDIEKITVEGFICDIRVEPGNSNEVHLKGEIRSTRNTPDLTILTDRKGNELKVWIEHKNITRGSIQGFLNFTAPSNVVLDLNTVSGDINVINIVSDNAQLNTVSGDISISGAGAGTDIKTVSGNIHASEIGGPLSAHAVSGDMKIENIKGPFNGRSTSGNFYFNMIEGKCSATSTSGDIIAGNLLNGAEFKSTSGDIKISVLKGNLFTKTTSGDVKLSDITGSVELWTTSGDQKGENIMILDSGSFNSISGDIYIDLDNALEELSFWLTSQSGDIKAGNMNGEKNLQIEKGRIRIKASSTSGDLIFQ